MEEANWLKSISAGKGARGRGRAPKIRQLRKKHKAQHPSKTTIERSPISKKGKTERGESKGSPCFGIAEEDVMAVSHLPGEAPQTS